MVTLFTFMVVNNWTIITQVYIDVLGTNAPILYFMAFWILSNLIILNLVIAEILEVYAKSETRMEEIFNKLELTR